LSTVVSAGPETGPEMSNNDEHAATPQAHKNAEPALG
jgi:hypothetical protein